MKRFEKRVWLASPTMHGDELRYMQEAYETNWMSTVGKNIDEVERLVAEKVGVKYAVALSAGTAALHLGTRLAGVSTRWPTRMARPCLSTASAIPGTWTPWLWKRPSKFIRT